MSQMVTDQLLHPESEMVPEDAIYRRRAVMALKMSKIMVGAILAVVGIGFVVWLASQQSSQVLAFIFLLFAILPGWALYPVFHQRGRTTLGLRIAIASIYAGIFFVPLLLPVLLPVVSVTYGLVIMMAAMFLGRHTIILVGTLCIFGLVADIGLIEVWGRDWFALLDETVGFIANAVIGFIAGSVMAFSANFILIDQEEQFHKAQQAKLEVERRAATETEQRELLEKANEEIEKRVLIEQGQRENLQSLLLQIRGVITVLTTSANEIQAAASQQLASATEQDAAVTQTVATVEEVRSTVEQTAERAQEVATTSQQTVAVSHQGQNAVRDTIDGMERIRGRVNDIAHNILILSERTQQIGEIIETVNALADQSKLLALNASIEAARAGDEGKGFAVVAMEVRQLAEQSRTATGRVQTILSEIQQATNTAVMVTEEGSKEAETGMKLVEQAGSAIRELAASLEAAAQAATQIAASTNQQTSGMNQLVSAITQFKQASAQTAVSTRQTEESIRNILETAQQLEEASAGSTESA